MAGNLDLNTIIGTVLSACDPATKLQDCVISEGGSWMDAGSTEIFEICYAGVVGIGFGAEEAAQDWLNRARKQLSVVDVELLA